MSEVATQVTLVAVNEVSDDEAEKLIESKGAEDLGEVAESMEQDVEALLATRVFGDADEVPILDVNTEVRERNE